MTESKKCSNDNNNNAKPSGKITHRKLKCKKTKTNPHLVNKCFALPGVYYYFISILQSSD